MTDRLPIAVFGLSACFGLVLGCGDQKVPTAPGGGGGTDPIAFTQVQTGLFDPNCALSGCHAGADPTGEMNLEAGQAYGNIVSVASSEIPGLNRIEPGSPDLSYMVKKLRGDPDIDGSPMPLEGEISEAQFQLLVDWVLQGAQR